MGTGLLWDDENVLKLLVVMVVQFCEYTKKPVKLYLLNEWIICELYLNKVVLLKKLLSSNLSTKILVHCGTYV